jgi:hypothetical protein
MKNWKTSLCGLLGSIGVSLQASEDQTVRTIGFVIIVIVPGLLGLFAKDKNVTGAGDNARSL